MKTLWGFVLALLLGFSATTSAQGTQSGTLSGTVKDQEGLVVPGATVTVTSPALQGARSTVSDENGNYSIPGLPPGTYAIRFELSGMTPVSREGTVVPLGGSAIVDASLGLANVTETVLVIAERSSVLSTPTAVTNLQAAEVSVLPIGRTPARIAEIAPGLTDNTPNLGQVTISGAFAYDNVFMIDGVDVNDNLFGTANNVFIEDAIAETQILTSGISAEYGRFSGGVINLVTKRGGNRFSGAYRLNLSKPSWSEETPLEESRGTERSDKLSTFTEGTLADRSFVMLSGSLSPDGANDRNAGVVPAVGHTVSHRLERRSLRGQIHRDSGQNHTVRAATSTTRPRTSTAQGSPPHGRLRLPRSLTANAKPPIRDNYNGVVS